MSLNNKIFKNNLDKYPKTKLSKILTDIITTPCEKVLKILNEIKNILLNVENSKKYIYELNWVIKIISSRSLYSIQINQKESLEQFQNEFPEMKQFLDLINLYNGQINETKKYNNYINKTMLFIENNEDKNENDNGVIRELGLQTPSSKLKRKNFFKFFKGKSEKKDNIINENKNEKKYDESDEDYEKKLNIFSSTRSRSFKLPNGKILTNQIKNARLTNNSKKHSTTIQKTPIEFSKENLQLIKEIIDNHNNENDDNDKSSSSYDNSLNLSNSDSLHFESKESNNTNNNNNNNNLNNNNNNLIFKFNDNKSINSHSSKKLNSSFDLEINPIKKFKEDFILAETKLNEANYNPKRVLSRSFDIHEFKKIVGYHNVMPLMAKQIFNFFSLDEKIINSSKLENFFKKISNGYHEHVLYHNAIHASDITQTACLIIKNSNFEEKVYSNIIDLLSIFVACLGHDIGHPGYNNGFLINSSNEIAINYNDISVLENFHTATLFRLINNDESVNIFDNFSKFDFKTLRKRIISNILATDMALHSKVLGLMKTKLMDNPEKQIITKDGKNIFEEQQNLFDFVVHVCDIAHNAKKFSISLQWVELLTNEFWKQGDKEKKLGLNVSFGCDREQYNIPISQVGFIKAFIVPTFDVLNDIFPSLDFFCKNVQNNLETWKSLSEQGRKTGWSPERKKLKENEDF